MKTAVLVPDDLYAKADEIARRLGKSRSRLYQEALAEHVSRRDADAVTEAMDEALHDLDDPADRWLAEAARATLERSEW